ncbi:uncharacterized protein LOC123003935 [Tribolium madens]|uniref:uncharacterized protein LOC123003935 n=1 Tax=Tribolium madens TaxID=41895 RepID=UPI001CF723E1|nr:uncharacterized protein LOC123003935 [Tribolium madens]
MAFINVKDCLTDPRQLIKLILLVVCVSITIYQLSECVNKIVRPPITSHYRFRYNQSIKYPAITVCRRPSFKSYLFPKFGIRASTLDLAANNLFENFPFNTTSLEDFLNATTYDFKEVVPLYGYNETGMGENLRFRKTFFTKRGLCHTMIPKEMSENFAIAGGFWLYLRHSAKDKTKDANGLSTTGFEIHIHDEFEVIKEEDGSNTGFVYVETGEDLHVTLTVQTYSQVSTTQQPCVKDPTYGKSRCEQKCVHNFAAKKVGCKVPWLRDLDQDYPLCSDYISINNITNAMTEKFSSQALSECDCQGRCNNTLYKYQIEHRRDVDVIQGSSSTIAIYFASNLVTELNDVISYDWNVFLADIGGSLGFLLGLSVIGFVNVIEEVVKLIFRVSGKEKTETLPQLEAEGDGKEGESLKSVMEFVANCDMYEEKYADKINKY